MTANTALELEPYEVVWATPDRTIHVTVKVDAKNAAEAKDIATQNIIGIVTASLEFVGINPKSPIRGHGTDRGFFFYNFTALEHWIGSAEKAGKLYWAERDLPELGIYKGQMGLRLGALQMRMLVPFWEKRLGDEVACKEFDCASGDTPPAGWAWFPGKAPREV